jgi:hypothetical protein
MCFRKKNLLLEINFPKEYWSRDGVIKYSELFILDGLLLAENPFSSYHRIIYKDIRRYKNHKKTIDRYDHTIFIFGDER